MKEYLRKINEAISTGKYKDTWQSLQQYKVPEWYEKSKFGIFIHWGVYSVPAFGSEWYSRNMYMQGSHEYEHHDGFQMYDSGLSEWNAKSMGPKRDILGEIFKACEKNGIVTGASSHRVEHWFFMGHGREFDSDIKSPMKHGDFYWPAMPERNHHDLFSEPAPTDEFLEDWLCRCGGEAFYMRRYTLCGEQWMYICYMPQYEWQGQRVCTFPCRNCRCKQAGL